MTAGAPRFSLRHLAPRLVRPSAKVAVAVVDVREALLLEVPEELDAAVGEHGGVGDVDVRLGGCDANRVGDAGVVGGCNGITFTARS